MSLKVLTIAQRLRPYTAADVADALVKLGLPSGGFLPDLKMHSPGLQGPSVKIIGPAQTVKFEMNDQKGVKPTIEGHYVDRVKPGHVVFLSQPPNLTNACWGGLMSMRSRHLGAVGTVIDGNVRDITEQREMQWPVFCKDVGTTAGAPVSFPSAMDVPVKLSSSRQQDTWVYPGDIIFADADGVVCIPKNLADRVADIVPVLAAIDQQCAQDVFEGKSITETFKLRRGKLNC